MNTEEWTPERWDTQWRYLLRSAYRLARSSPDPSTQNGAVLIDSTTIDLIAAGFNAFPIGVQYSEERWERPAKYSFIEHAERASIYRAAVLGVSTKGSTMVCPWAACSDCARAIVCAGVTRLVRHKDASDRSPDWWVDSIAVADTILAEGGVNVIDIVGSVGAPEVRHTGIVWHP